MVDEGQDVLLGHGQQQVPRLKEHFVEHLRKGLFLLQLVQEPDLVVDGRPFIASHLLSCDPVMKTCGLNRNSTSMFFWFSEYVLATFLISFST
jgi:hypothetical protein